MPSQPVFQIHGGVQSYDWGTLGRDGSKCAQFGKQIPGFKYDESKPYAEVGLSRLSLRHTPDAVFEIAAVDGRSSYTAFKSRVGRYIAQGRPGK